MAAESSQVEIAKKIQVRLLEYWLERLQDKTISPTDAATATRFLINSGWTVDPSQLPDAMKNLVNLPKVDDAIEQDRIIDIAEARASRQA